MTTMLDGLRVLEFGQFIAGPGATQELVDLGAEVIKVEPPEGDVAWNTGNDTGGPGFGRSMYRQFNRGKRSICIDLTAESGRDVARRLVRDSDVVVQNLRPGVLEAFGLGPEAALELNPRLVYVSINGFGSEGPASTRPGLDTSAQAEGGIMTVNGTPDQGPMRVGFTVVDSSTAHLAALAAVAGTVRVLRTGVGVATEVSLLNTALSLGKQRWGEYLLGGPVPHQTGNGQGNVAPAADRVLAGDGYVVLSAYVDRHWAKLCAIIDRPDLLDHPDYASNKARVAHRAALLEELHQAFAHLTRDEVVRLLNSGGVVCAAVRDFEEVFEQQRDDPMSSFVEVGEGEPFWAVGSAIRDEEPRSSRRPPAYPGEHTDAILGDLGLPPDLLPASRHRPAESAPAEQVVV